VPDVAIALITRGGQVLITQRQADDSFPLHWEFPGGTCEPGESLEQCVAREMQEELGVTVSIEGRGPEVVRRDPGRTVRLVSFWCRLVTGRPRPLASAACRWVVSAELPAYRFPPASGPFIQAVGHRLREAT